MDLLKLVSQYDGFYSRPPMDNLKYYYTNDELICFCNDGLDVWFGSRDNWYHFMKHTEFRIVIFWYLKTWIFKDLCGFRTWLYYKLLNRKLRGIK